MSRLLVFAPYYPPHVGGLELHALQFNAHLAATGWQITVFTPALPAQSAVASPHHIIRFPAFELIPGYPIPKLWTPAFWRVWRMLSATRYDVTISRTRFFITSLLAYCYQLLHPTIWVHVEHGSDYPHLRGVVLPRFSRLYDQTLGRLVLRQADAVVANSQGTKQFIHRLVKRPVQVIYRGVEQECIARTVPDTSLRTRYFDRCIVTYVGRLMIGKGVQDLLTAIAELSELPLELVIIGDGPYREKLEDEAQRHRVTTHIHFWGERPWKEAVAAIKASDIVVNPSYTEGMPSSVIEAALCQRAIIATDVGGTAEVVRDQQEALLIPARQPAALAAALRQLAHDPKQRAQLGAAAHKRARTLFSWSRAIEQYQRLFSELRRA